VFIHLQVPFTGGILLNIDDIVCVLHKEGEGSQVYLRNGLHFDVLEYVEYIATLLDGAQHSEN
jgi:predicted deacylase